jgi:hypothetical protein
VAAGNAPGASGHSQPDTKHRPFEALADLLKKE